MVFPSYLSAFGCNPQFCRRRVARMSQRGRTGGRAPMETCGWPPDIAARHGPSREPITSPTRRSSGLQPSMSLPARSIGKHCFFHSRTGRVCLSDRQQGICVTRSGLSDSDRRGFKYRRECDAAFACLLELDRYTYHGSHIGAEFCLRSDRSPVPNTCSGNSRPAAALGGPRSVQACSDYPSENCESVTARSATPHCVI